VGRRIMSSRKAVQEGGNEGCQKRRRGAGVDQLKAQAVVVAVRAAAAARSRDEKTVLVRTPCLT